MGINFDEFVLIQKLLLMIRLYGKSHPRRFFILNPSANHQNEMREYQYFFFLNAMWSALFVFNTNYKMIWYYGLSGCQVLHLRFFSLVLSLVKDCQINISIFTFSLSPSSLVFAIQNSLAEALFTTQPIFAGSETIYA